MRFTIVPMNDAYARAVAGWHYEGVYAFYDLESAGFARLRAFANIAEEITRRPVTPSLA